MNNIKMLTGLVLFVFGVAFSMPIIAASKNDRNQLLAKTRAATAKYHRVERALADGYVQGPCVPQMGHHYVKPALMQDLVTTETQPEVLLYGDSPDGLKLVGVEYFVAAVVPGEPPYLWYGETAPEGGFLKPTPEQLFAGQALYGPMEGHDTDMPWHYDLHVWIWQHNPQGMFSVFNPTVKCN